MNASVSMSADAQLGIANRTTGTTVFGALAPITTGTVFLSEGKYSIQGDIKISTLVMGSNTEVLGPVGGSGKLTITEKLTTGTTSFSGAGELVIDPNASWDIDPDEAWETSFEGWFITNKKTVKWMSGDIKLMEGSGFKNEGAGSLFEIRGASGRRIKDGTDGMTFVQFNNEGTVRSFLSVSAWIEVWFVSSGNVQVGSATLTFGNDFGQTGGTTTVTDGTIEVIGTYQLDSGAAFVGYGTVHTTEGFINSGSVSLGTDTTIRTLNVTGAYTQTSTGTLSLRVARTGGVLEHDRLLVSGTATLDGTLALTYLGGYSPQAGDSLTVLTAGSRVGIFAQTPPDFGQPAYGPQSVGLVK